MMSEAKLDSSGLLPAKTESFIADSEDNKSSSTEGPDSPDQSSSASPIPPSMMISPHHILQNDDFQPLYSVRFTDHITKNGDVIKYRLNVIRLKDSQISTIDREYEDFEYLHHAVSTSGNKEGICFPPLPLKPSTDPHSAEARAKLQLGNGNRILRGEDYSRNIRLFEKYLYMTLAHPILGELEALCEFLEKPEAPIRAKIRRGLFESMFHNFDLRGQSVTPDIDEWFQKERDWLGRYSADIKKNSDAYHELINCRLRLANQLCNLSSITRVNGDLNTLNSKLSDCFAEETSNTECLIASEDCTLGVYLGLYSNYSQSLNTMMNKRTSLMIEYDNASKALAKAKLSKIGAAKVTKDALETRYNDCSNLAKVEIKRFHQRRITEMKEAILHYTEGQIKAAKEASGGLFKAVESFKNIS
uniref:Sorting nexin-6-like n=1 Tax=Caligus clemensi TaxID=344056 RepID=C1C2F3_CALCM|nr:Sorting nexin-6-like [Caligus clemensi]